MVEATIYLDNDRYPRAKIDPPFELLESFLVADMQTIESCDLILEGIQMIESGALLNWDSTGNLYTAILSPLIARIENAYDDIHACDVPLNDFKELLLQWREFTMKTRRS